MSEALTYHSITHVAIGRRTVVSAILLGQVEDVFGQEEIVDVFLGINYTSDKRRQSLLQFGAKMALTEGVLFVCVDNMGQEIMRIDPPEGIPPVVK